MRRADSQMTFAFCTSWCSCPKPVAMTPSPADISSSSCRRSATCKCLGTRRWADHIRLRASAPACSLIL